MEVIRGEWDGELDEQVIYMLNTDIARDPEYDRGMNWVLVVSELRNTRELHTWWSSIEDWGRRRSFFRRSRGRRTRSGIPTFIFIIRSSTPLTIYNVQHLTLFSAVVFELSHHPRKSFSFS